MIVEMTGKVIGHRDFVSKAGKKFYILTIEEGGIYPKKFEWTTETESVIPRDTIASVGKEVTVRGWLNSYSKTFTGKDGKQHEMLSYSLKLASVRDPSERVASPSPAPSAPEEISDDIPF